MVSRGDDRTVEALLAEAGERELRAAFSALPDTTWAELAAFPAWTTTAAAAAGILPAASPLDEGPLRGAIASRQIHVDSSPVELYTSSGEVIEHEGAIFWLEPASRGRLLRKLPDASLTPTVRAAARRLLAAGVPLPFPTWRAAELAARDDPAKALRDRVAAALPQGWGEEALAGGQPDVALAWVRAARHLAESLGSADQEDLRLAAELSGRSIDLHHRRRDDMAKDRAFIPIEAPLAAVNAFLDGEGDPWGLHVVGQGGVGKTMLLRHMLLERARTPGWAVARVDFDFLDPSFPRREPWLLLLAIVAELRLQARTAGDTALFSELSDELVNLQEGTAQGTGSPFEHPLFTGVLNLLGRAVGERSVLVLLDTCEELERLGGVAEGAEAVAAMFRTLEEMKARMKRLRVLLGGRRALGARGHGWTAAGTPLAPRPWLFAIELFGFQSSDAAALLAREGARSRRTDWSAVAEAIRARAEVPEPKPVLDSGAVRGTFYLPYELSLLSEWAAEDDKLTAEHLRATDRDVYVERRILPRLRGALRDVLPGLVACGTFDRDLVKSLAGEAEGDLAWREASRQEWVTGTEWIVVSPSFRRRLDEVFRRTGGSGRARRDELSARARAHLCERLDRDPVTTSASAVEAWARAGRMEDDADCWARWEERAAEMGAWDWIDRVTGQLLAKDGPAEDAPEPHPLRSRLLLSRARAIAALRPGLLREWEEIWTNIGRGAVGALAIRAQAHVLAVRLIAKGPAATDNAAQTLAAFVAAPADVEVVPALLTAIDAALEAGMDVPSGTQAFLEWLLETAGTPMREEAAALAIRVARREERVRVADRWTKVALAEPAPPFGIPWEWPWRIDRRSHRILEIGASLWPSCESPGALQKRLSSGVGSLEMEGTGDGPDRLAALWLQLSAAQRLTVPPALRERKAGSSTRPLRRTAAAFPPRGLAVAREQAALGWLEKAIATGTEELDDATKLQDPVRQYVAERTLVDILTLARPADAARWRFRNLELSTRFDDRLDAASFSWICAGTPEIRVREWDRLMLLDLAWQAGDWQLAEGAVERLNTLVGKLVEPLPHVLRALIALAKGLGELPSFYVELPLALRLDLVEGAWALRDAGLDAPLLDPPLSTELARVAKDLSGRDPSAALRLSARGHAVAGTSWSPLHALSRRLGLRRAARLVRMEGERLAVRVPAAGARLLRMAQEWFSLSGDLLGALMSQILAALAARRAPQGSAPETARAELVEAWNAVAEAGSAPLPMWAEDLFKRDMPVSPWAGWIARMALALGEEPRAFAQFGHSPELRPRPLPLGGPAIQRVGLTVLQSLGTQGPPWFRDWLRAAVGSEATGNARLRADRLSPDRSTGGERGLTRSGADRTTVQVRVEPETDHIAISVRLGSEWLEAGISGLEKIKEEAPSWLSGVRPTSLYVDESSAGQLWEELLDAPEAVRFTETRAGGSRALALRGLRVVSDDPTNERLAYAIWGEAGDLCDWQRYLAEMRPVRTLHVFTRPVEGSRGVLLGADTPFYEGTRSAPTLVEATRLLGKEPPSLIVLELPMDQWGADPEPKCAHLRIAAFELSHAGAGAVLVLPPLPAQLAFDLASKGLLRFDPEGDLRAQVTQLRDAVRRALAHEPDPTHREAATRITLYLSADHKGA